MAKYEVGFVSEEPARRTQERFGCGEVLHSDDIPELPEDDVGWSVVGGEDVRDAAKEYGFIVMDLETGELI